MLRLSLMLMVIAIPLAGCSFGAPPQSAAEQADLAACTQRADAINAARHYAYLSRTSQFATPLLGTPNQNYVDNKLAQLHDRQDRINACMRDSNPAYAGNGNALPEPRIVGPAE